MTNGMLCYRPSSYLIMYIGLTEILSFSLVTAYSYIEGPTPAPAHCPGLYCGRQHQPDNTWGSCGACPRGYRTNETSACQLCESSPTFYDWLYLGFMAVIALVLHWFCIDRAAKYRRFTSGVLALHISALIETGVAAVLTLLIVEPYGSFRVRSCSVEQLSDWYTLLHNPTPDYEETLHCTQEAVYPLYTMVFLFYALAVLILLLVRPLVSLYFLPGPCKMSIYAALYFFPILALIQAVCGGLIYYSFPYIVIILSIISNAAHFAFQLDQSMKSLLLTTITDMRNIVILFGHWALHTYGIIAITQLRQPAFHASLIALVPIPAAFYILTARFTDPNKLHAD